MTDNPQSSGEYVAVAARALLAARYGQDRAWETTPRTVREALLFDGQAVLDALGLERAVGLVRVDDGRHFRPGEPLYRVRGTS